MKPNWNERIANDQTPGAPEWWQKFLNAPLGFSTFLRNVTLLFRNGITFTDNIKCSLITQTMTSGTEIELEYSDLAQTVKSWPISGQPSTVITWRFIGPTRIGITAIFAGSPTLIRFAVIAG